MTNILYQNFRKFNLPITMNPLEYGKLILEINNIFILQINKTNVVLITQYDDLNHVKLFKEGDLSFEYKDHKISNNSFVRSIENRKFTFKNGKLINIDHIISVIILTIIFIMLIKYPENYIYFNLSVFPIKNIIKLRKTKNLHDWKTMEFSIDNLFTKDIFNNIFNKFWNKINHEFSGNNHMYILFKIKYTGSNYITIGNLQRINQEEKNWYLNWIINNMIYKGEYYNETLIESFIISYGFKEGLAQSKEVKNKDLNFQNYRNYKLIISFNPLDFGKLLNITKLVNETLYILIDDNNFIIKILHNEKKNIIEISKDGDTIIKFIDNKLTENRFLRILENKKYYFENNKEILYIKEMKSKFISKLKPIKNFNNKFITFDIETYIKDSVLKVFCISIYDGINKNSFVITDYNNSEDFILAALKSILLRKYNGFNIYIHNMANFDIIFLMKYLVTVGSINPIIHNGRIISITLNYGKNNEYQINFRDSYLLLPKSLAELTKGFNVETLKSVFPYLFVNENNLNYIGEVPQLKYFDNKISKTEYSKYKNNFNNNWNLKLEAIKYCEIDVISLHQVIYKFGDMIYNLFGRNIHHHPTLPSLAFAIFRSNFMVENNIPQLSGKIAEDIRSGYTGGAVDVYIPKPPKGVKVKGYDVNSLYPSQMFEKLMPVGNPSYFKGDIRKIDPNAFGFFYCEIIAPDDIKHPILQTHVKTNGGIRTIAPLGTWEEMMFSGEIDNAIKYGYKVNILWGYTFNKKIIFKDYVDFLYKLRNNYPKSDPMNYIAKILLNSLYGRFGMDDLFLEINVIHKDFYSDFENKFIDYIVESIDLGEYKLVRYKNPNNQIEEGTHNISIGIAAAITAYARIHMSIFKNNPDIKLYYTDTDSAYTDSEIDPKFIDNKALGKLKLENVCKKAIFLAPKVYCLETEENKFIYKVKGLKHNVELTINEFEHLLFKNKIIEKSQVKWKKNLSEAHINLIKQLYTLKVTDNKRQLIYDKNNKLIGTKAFVIDKDKDIRFYNK